MNWSQIDWAVVAATLFGPIFAVAITLWHQSRSEERRCRADLFAAMMRYRRHPASPEFVGSLNIVPVHFRKHYLVMQRYSELMELFEDAQWSNKDEQIRRRLLDRVDTKIAYLLSAISEALGQKIEQLQILKGGYAPQGWQDDENMMRSSRLQLQALLEGKAALPVIVVPNQIMPPPPNSDGAVPR